MITITIEESDGGGRVLGRHTASGTIDPSDAKGVAELLARCVGGLMYHHEVPAETPLLLAAARTHGASRCAQALAHAVELAEGRYSFDFAVKPVVDVDQLLGYRAGKRERSNASRMLKIMGASVRGREDDE